MAKQDGHAARIGTLSLTTTPAVRLHRCGLTVLVVVALGLAMLAGRLWAHTIPPDQRPSHVNGTVPPRTPVSHALKFSRFPSDAEITQARVFSMPLLKMKAGPADKQERRASAQENRALAGALLAYTQATDPDDMSALTEFLGRYPRSQWRAGLLAHLGLLYRQRGRFEQAVEAFDTVWALTKHRTGRNATVVANWAIGELADLHTHLGHTARLQELVADLRGRKLSGPATEQWTAAVESLAHQRQHGKYQASCGIMALSHVFEHAGRAVTPSMLAASAVHDSMSLLQVHAVAQQAGLPLQMAQRSDGASIPVPAVMHWRRGHYSAIVDRQEQDGRVWYLVENPLAQEAVWIRQEVLDAETSGYFLIPGGDMPTGWQQASLPEAEGVSGKCWQGSKDQEQTSQYAMKIKPDPPSPPLPAPTPPVVWQCTTSTPCWSV